jgi:two-component system chemotaxis response regulator CheB
VIKLLVVDDSALMRRQLLGLFEQEGDFVVHQARNGKEAVIANREFEPDVVTLDINMPEMDGLTALSQMMVERAVRVVMVSSLTEQGALATLEALNLGAIDYVAKPGGTISLSIGAIKAELVRKVRDAARARIRTRSQVKGLVGRLREERARPRPEPVRRRAGEGVVAIGVSTGGPRTLEDILPLLPADFPWPVVVAQHMPAAFTKPFAERLDALCPLSVVEASHPMPLEAGVIYIGKGGADMLVVNRAGKLNVIARPESPAHLWHPSVELLGRSLLEHIDPTRVIAVMLTGMGYDGADAFAEVKKRGGRTVAESQESAVVFGMPSELIERGGASVVLAADKIAAQINRWVGG